MYTNIVARKFSATSIYRGVEQLAARWAHNPKVGGSSPPPATKKESNVFGESTLLFCFML